MSTERTPVSSRRGIKLDEETKQLYKLRDRSRDDDPNTRMLSPEQWENAMRRDEFLRSMLADRKL